MTQRKTVAFWPPADGSARATVAQISEFVAAREMEGLEWFRTPYPIDIAYQEPPAAQHLADLGPGDNLILCQILHLGRSKYECLNWLEVASRKQIGVYMVPAYWPPELSMSSELFISLLSAIAEAERTIGREQTREALAESKRAGIRLGRPKGSADSELDQYRFEIEALLATGITQGYVAQRYGVSLPRFRYWLKQRGLNQSSRNP